MYDKNSHEQRFFLGHDDDITSLDLHPDKVSHLPLFTCVSWSVEVREGDRLLVVAEMGQGRVWASEGQREGGVCQARDEILRLDAVEGRDWTDGQES